MYITQAEDWYTAALEPEADYVSYCIGSNGSLHEIATHVMTVIAHRLEYSRSLHMSWRNLFPFKIQLRIWGMVWLISFIWALVIINIWMEWHTDTIWIAPTAGSVQISYPSPKWANIELSITTQYFSSLTHWDRNKMDNVFKGTFSKAFFKWKYMDYVCNFIAVCS